MNTDIKNRAIIKTANGRVLFDEEMSTTCVCVEMKKGKTFVFVPCKRKYKVQQIYTEQDLFGNQTKIFIV